MNSIEQQRQAIFRLRQGALFTLGLSLLGAMSVNDPALESLRYTAIFVGWVAAVCYLLTPWWVRRRWDEWQL